MSIVTGILLGFLFFREALSYFERKRLMNMIYAKSTGELVRLEEEPRDTSFRKNILVRQRERQNEVENG